MPQRNGKPHGDDIEHVPFMYPKERPLFMSQEMEELRRCFAKLETGQEELRTGQNELRNGQHDLRKAQGMIDSKIDMMDEAVRKVKESVTGDVNFGVKGLAERMKEIEEKQKTYDKIYYKAMGIALLMGVIWPILVALLLKWLTSYIGK